MSLLETYRTVTQLTREMLEAARVQDWDRLAEAGGTRDRLVAQLPAALPAMPARDAEQIRRLIEEMLACHGEILDRAGPWLEHVGKLLAAFASVPSVPAAPADVSQGTEGAPQGSLTSSGDAAAGGWGRSEAQ